MLEKANASIHDIAQVRLLEFKQSEPDNELQLEQAPTITTATTPKKKWWFF